MDFVPKSDLDVPDENHTKGLLIESKKMNFKSWIRLPQIGSDSSSRSASDDFFINEILLKKSIVVSFSEYNRCRNKCRERSKNTKSIINMDET